jgi:filamentous hemagglutinin
LLLPQAKAGNSIAVKYAKGNFATEFSITWIENGEILFATSTLAVDAYRSELEQTSEGRDFLDVYDKLMIAFVAYQGGKIVAGLPEAFTKLKSAWTKYGKQISAIDNEIAALEKEMAGVAKGGDEIIWNYIKATQEVYPGSILPKSFELTTPTSKIWVHPNATEHIAEFIQMKAANFAPEAVRLATQVQLKSLHAAVSESIKSGITYDKLLEIGGWELKFSPAREAGQLPALIHALPK